MSPKGGRRRQPRRSRQPDKRSPHPDQSPLSGVDKAIEQELCRAIFDALQGLDDVPDPMSVEITMSQLLGQWWAMPTVGDVGPDGVFGNMVVRYAKEQRSPLGLLVLSTLAVIAPLPDVRAAAAAAAQSLTDRGVRQPAATGIGEVTVGRCWVAADVYGDQADVVAEFAYGDERHALVVLVDHNLGGIAKDAFSVDDVDATLTELQNAAAADELLASPRQIEPSLGRALVESAGAASDLVRGEPVSDDYAKSRALLLARLRAMPEGTQPTAEEPTPELQAALVADFFASPEAADLDPETAGHLVRLFVEYGCAREPSRPIRISPLKLEEFLHRWLPRRAPLDGGERAALPATVRALVAWARSRMDLPGPAVRDLDEATEDILGAFAGEYDDPNNFGLARQLLQAMGGPGRRAQRAPTAKKATPAPAARAPSSKRAPTGSYQIKVTLHGAKPPIWRRLMVPASVTLADLHLIIQYAMGWDNYHLHLFDVGGVRYGEPDPELELELRDEGRVRLRDVAPAERAKIRYEYDFGDGWEHDIVVEKIVDEPVQQVVLLAGRRACPPEDCGGIPGYYHLLDVLSDPTHDEFEHLSTWVGGDFAPDELDIDGINDLLGAMVLGPQRRSR